jgi:Amino-transferase class IV
VVTMVTLLWEPHIDVDSGISGVRVRAHAFSNLVASNSEPVINPNPSVKVVVGCLPTGNLEASDESMVLPNRYKGFPNSKLSSWCRQRRPLEELFKGADIGDVILTKSDVDSGSSHCGKGPSSGTIELLEGLTSNLFVVGPGNIIRTPPSSLVLEGYARQLVMDAAVKCGYRVEICPILLEGLPSWEDVFLTSSIRLIIPVQVMLLPSDHPSSDPSTPMQFDTVWERPSHHDDGSLLACHVLYREICRQREGRGCADDGQGGNN